MAVVVDPDLLDFMASNSGMCTFVLKDVSPEAGLVLVSASTMVGSIRIRDAGTARNVEIQLTTDPAKVAEAHVALSDWQFPPEAEIRVDRR